MKGYLLDTNCVSELVSIKPEPLVTAWLDQANESSLYLSVLTLGEIRKGIAGLPRNGRRAQLEEWLSVDLQRGFAERILPVDAAIADRWGRPGGERPQRQISHWDSGRADRGDGPYFDLVVVTRHTRDFEKTGAGLRNPWKPL